MSQKYDMYIREHINNLGLGLKWFEKNHPKALVGIENQIKQQLLDHDDSKGSEEEYGPYDEYFYGSKDNVDEFNYAWLHHIHNNPHHWQYWVLVNDEDGTIALDMPYNYIIEMILDWWSFSWKSNNLYEIFSWYEEHKKTMILNENTKIIVESMLKDMKEILDKQKKDMIWR